MVHARALRASAPPPSDTSVPPPVGALIEKVALCSYKVTDDDIDVLRASGYSDNMVFELVVAASVGAAAAVAEHGRRVAREVGAR